jgi:hypothetical protein
MRFGVIALESCNTLEPSPKRSIRSFNLNRNMTQAMKECLKFPPTSTDHSATTS